MTQFTFGKVGRTALSASLIGMLLATTACSGSSSATGQTIAVVNGEQITLSDLNFELAALPPEQRERARSDMIKALVSRKLLAQDAKKKGIDKNPDFILQERRTRELMLAQSDMQASGGLNGQPISEAEVSTYVGAHPNIAAGHAILIVDQLQFKTPTGAANIDALKPAKTLEELAAILKTQGITPKPVRAQIDTAGLSDDTLARIAALKPGEPLVSVNGAGSIANAIAETRSVPIPADQARVIARKQIANARVKARLEQYDRALRNSATITYADKYAPKD